MLWSSTGIVAPSACACAHRRQGASLRSAPASRGSRPVVVDELSRMTPFRMTVDTSPVQSGALLLPTRGSVTVCSAWVWSWSMRSSSWPQDQRRSTEHEGHRHQAPRERAPSNEGRETKGSGDDEENCRAQCRRTRRLAHDTASSARAPSRKSNASHTRSATCPRPSMPCETAPSSTRRAGVRGCAVEYARPDSESPCRG